VTTPTFVVGACFVIVATLAYGTAQTHLLYSGLPPCQAANCSTTGPTGSSGQTLRTSAKPGVGGKRTADPGGTQTRTAGGPSSSGGGQQTSPTPASTGNSGGQPTGSPPSPPVTAGSQPGPKVAVLFKDLKTWDGGFLAQVTIVNDSNAPLTGWQLWLRYKDTQIDHVWDARFFQQTPASRSVGLMAPLPHQPAVRAGGGSERFTFKASGPAGAPVGCEFDGYSCSFKVMAGTTQKGSPGRNGSPSQKGSPQGQGQGSSGGGHAKSAAKPGVSGAAANGPASSAGSHTTGKRIARSQGGYTAGQGQGKPAGGHAAGKHSGKPGQG
jgi:hypothetical protein